MTSRRRCLSLLALGIAGCSSDSGTPVAVAGDRLYTVVDGRSLYAFDFAVEE